MEMQPPLSKLIRRVPPNHGESLVFLLMYFIGPGFPLHGSLVELVKTSASQVEDEEFESLMGRQYTGVDKR